MTPQPAGGLGRGRRRSPRGHGTVAGHGGVNACSMALNGSWPVPQTAFSPRGVSRLQAGLMAPYCPPLRGRSLPPEGMAL